MTDETTLLPCPKCGSEVIGYAYSLDGSIFDKGEWTYCVECECGITWDSDFIRDTPKEAREIGIKIWNRRYTDDDLR